MPHAVRFCSQRSPNHVHQGFSCDSPRSRCYCGITVYQFASRPTVNYRCVSGSRYTQRSKVCSGEMGSALHGPMLNGL